MLSRRNFICSYLLLSLYSKNFFKAVLANNASKHLENKVIRKKVGKTDRTIPSIGMGTWLTFDVGYNTKKIIERTKVLETFFQYGGELIDSSPMYGTSEKVIGKCLQKISSSYKIFSATKIWTPNTWHGKKQISNSIDLWKISKFDLIQVHNLVNVEKHLETLFELRKNRVLNCVGITTSHGLRHKKLIRLMQTYDIDFIQFTYNILDDVGEKYILELAHEKIYLL